MKILQTYWSKPSQKLGSEKNIHERYNGGYLSARHHYMAWALSCLRLREYYDEVELVTDEEGKQLLIEKLGIPYTNVHVCLDQFNNYPEQLWTIPKVYSYSLLQEPFIHADGDVFIWKKFDDEIVNASLVAQNLEYNFSFYADCLEYIFTFKNIPAVISEYDWKQNGIYSINAGIIGGNDLYFFKEYSQVFLKFFEKNKTRLDNENIGKLNIIFEQYLFYRMAVKKNKQINYLLSEVKADYTDLLKFDKVPQFDNYIHLIGSAKKTVLHVGLLKIICDLLSQKITNT